jgi:heterodisulfide reductase subunit C
MAAEIQRRSGVNIGACWHCNSCANGCPFSEAMDFRPNAVIRLAQLGLRREALQSSGIWICVGCNTCSIQCPNAIDIPAVNDSLRRMALEEGAAVAEPGILAFHEEVLHSIERYGRTHKLAIMMRYKLRRQDWFGDMRVGVRMMLKRKLDFLPSRSSIAGKIKNLLPRRESAHFHAKSE